MSVLVVALFSALLLFLLVIDRVAVSRSAKTILRSGLALAAIALAFELGTWQGSVLLLATVAAVELGRLIRKRVKTGV